MYPDTLTDYREVHKVEKYLSIHERIGRFLSSPAFIIGVFILWSCFLVSGCAGQKMFLSHPKTDLPLYQCKLPVRVYLDESVPHYDGDTIEQAFIYWNIEIGYPMFIFEGYGFDIDMDTDIVVFGLPESAAKEKKDRGAMYPEVSKNGCIVAADIIYYPEHINRNYNSLKTLISHEAGHSLGLNHSEKENNLMYPTIPDELLHFRRASRQQIKALKNIYNLR